ncbi:MAG TPA: hypothetical protein VI844_03605, partial [Coxiellaceae bacterium]|nr:hypothetical protein [Coxiellaceae bacterium]
MFKQKPYAINQAALKTYLKQLVERHVWHEYERKLVGDKLKNDEHSELAWTILLEAEKLYQKNHNAAVVHPEVLRNAAKAMLIELVEFKNHHGVPDRSKKAHHEFLVKEARLAGWRESDALILASEEHILFELQEALYKYYSETTLKHGGLKGLLTPINEQDKLLAARLTEIMHKTKLNRRYRCRSKIRNAIKAFRIVDKVTAHHHDTPYALS